MRTESLQYLIEISKCKSMNVASENLHISPQALSTAIKKLEKELNMQLVERTTTGATLTKNGMKVKEIALQFFYDLDELHSSEKSCQSNIMKHLYLNVPYGFCETYLSMLLETLYTEFPSVEVVTTPHSYQDIIRSVEQEQNTFALTYKLFLNGEDLLKDISPDLSFTPLFESKFYSVVPDNFSVKNYKTISLKSLFEYPILSYQPANYLFEPVYNYYLDVTPKIINCPTVNAQLSMLSKGVGIAFGMYDIFSNEPLLQYPSNVSTVSLREKLIGTFGYITMKNKPLDHDTITQLQFLDRFYHNN